MTDLTTTHPRCELCADHPADAQCWMQDFKDGDPAEGVYRCRHCPAQGHECPQCEGELLWTDSDDVEHDCDECEGWGVIESPLSVEVARLRLANAALAAACEAVVRIFRTTFSNPRDLGREMDRVYHQAEAAHELHEKGGAS